MIQCIAANDVGTIRVAARLPPTSGRPPNPSDPSLTPSKSSSDGAALLIHILPHWVSCPPSLLSTDEDLVDWDVNELDDVADASHDGEPHGDSAADLEVLCR